MISLIHIDVPVNLDAPNALYDLLAILVNRYNEPPIDIIVRGYVALPTCHPKYLHELRNAVVFEPINAVDHVDAVAQFVDIDIDVVGHDAHIDMTGQVPDDGDELLFDGVQLFFGNAFVDRENVRVEVLRLWGGGFKLERAVAGHQFEGQALLSHTLRIVWGKELTVAAD